MRWPQKLNRSTRGKRAASCFLTAALLCASSIVERCAFAGTYYWDPDLNAANNNSTTGAGLGGSQTWSTTAAALRWWDGTSSTNVAWTTTLNAQDHSAVFWGTAGRVDLSASVNVNTLTLNTADYFFDSASTVN